VIGILRDESVTIPATGQMIGICSSRKFTDIFQKF
jgi:hypothetical protein